MNSKSIQFARWSVYVLVKGKRLRKKFNDDFRDALKFYTQCKDKELPCVLHSDNTGFPPPQSITKHPKVRYEIVRHKGKRVKKKIEYTINLMTKYNDRGIWWCPYCIRLFEFKEGERYGRKEIWCPVCGIGNRDFNVRRANPKSVVVEMYGRVRRPRGRRRRAHS
jgi:hypothetical protein